MISPAFTQARAQLAVLTDQSKQGENISISKHGQTTAVLLSNPEYQKLNDDHLTIADKLRIWREQFNHELAESTDNFDVGRAKDQGHYFS